MVLVVGVGQSTCVLAWVNSAFQLGSEAQGDSSPAHVRIPCRHGGVELETSKSWNENWSFSTAPRTTNDVALHAESYKAGQDWGVETVVQAHGLIGFRLACDDTMDLEH